MECPYCNKIVNDNASECECGYKFKGHKEKSIEGSKGVNKIPWDGINPRCPNEKCDNSYGDISVEDAFKVATIEQGLMGKVFRQDAVNMVFCTKCGHIIGVASKG